MLKKMLVPLPAEGIYDTIPSFPGYNWLNQLPNKKIYFALFQRWPQHNLPYGYDYYIVSFHLEVIDIAWLKRQKVSGPIIVLADGQSYNFEIPGVHFLSFFYWHHQLNQMQEWFGVKEKTIPTYKFSAVCNRVSQSKVWVTTKLLETAKDSSLIVLNSWIEEKNVHNWNLTGNKKLDQLTQSFRDHYSGQEIKIDEFDNDTQNQQSITGNPWQPLYQDCVIHFTNESFHYSRMVEDDKEYIWPGPFITEKTLKCLLGSTAFVPVGQFETYRTLTNLGLNFDYDFNTAWDLDPGNLSRAERIVDLIDDLNQYDVAQLTNKTQRNNEYNQNYIISGKFFDQCQRKNEESIVQIFNLIC